MTRRFLVFFIGWLLVWTVRGQEVEFVTGFEFEFDEVREFSEGLAAYKRDDRWGLVDTSGVIITNAKFEEIRPFSEGLAAVRQNNKWGFIDENGETIIPIALDEVKNCSEDLIAFSIRGLWGFIDKEGNYIVHARYKEVTSFSEGIAAVRQFNRWNFIDKNGKIIVPTAKIKEFRGFSENLAAIKQNGFWDFVNKNGEFVTNNKFTNAMWFSEGLAAVKFGNKWGFTNKKGELKIGFKYTSVEPFTNGLSIVSNDKKWNIINTKDIELIDFQTSIRPRILNKIYYKIQKNVLDKNGNRKHIEEVYKIKNPSSSRIFEHIEVYNSGFAKIRKNGKYGFVNHNLEEAVNTKYNNATSFSENHAWLKKDGKWAIIKAINLRLHEEEINHDNVNMSNPINKPQEKVKPISSNKTMLNNGAIIEDVEDESIPVVVASPPSTVTTLPTTIKDKVTRQKINPHKIISKILPFIHWQVPAANVETNVSTYVIKANIRSDTSLNTIRYEISGQRLDVKPYQSRRKTYQYIETVQLQEGENIITLVAENAAGVTRSKPMTITYIPPPKVWAVVVGIDHYREAAPLRYTRNDAYEFRSHLLSPEGGAVPRDQIYLLLNDRATKENILAKLRAVQRQAGERDRFYFYFSGHGRDGNFLPYDYRTSESITLLRHTEIIEIINQMSATQKIILADACHSGSMTSRSSDKPIARYYDALTQGKKGVAVITSCQGDEVALEKNGLQHGVFSYYFHEGLQGKADSNDDKIITIKEAFEYARPRTNQYTQGTQTPEIKGQYDPEMMIGVVRK